ncbi:ABC transporter substrate-binding protein [Aquihabitans sp. McL0605]|uniref:ABC transporter substrate-binding protein n=1 Tax=Aquihabitans sp. McL0605 TaxID=3415671 RepID=UPI003CEABEEE
MPDRPIDPELAAAVEFTKGLSRRRLLASSGLALGAAALGPTLLSACGSSSSGSKGDTGPNTTPTKKLVISNWDAYIDEDANGDVAGPGTTISNFEKETGIKVTYRKDFNDNDEYFNKIYLPVLGKGKTISADITVPTQWMAARIIGLGWIEELLLDEIPNHKNLNKAYLNLPWDPGAKHFMPWQAGITGIAYNPKLTGRALNSANDLYDPAFKGKVTFLTELHDAVGLTMFGQGNNPKDAKLDDVNKALAKIKGAANSGQILKFTGNEYLRSLENGDVAVAMAWSGDIAQLDPKLGIKFIIPDEGGMQWFDAMTVAKGAPNSVAAAKWMNYVYDPENAAQITEFVQYISPVDGVKEALEKKGGDAAKLASNPLVFPDAETLSRVVVFGDQPQAEQIATQKAFNDITG